MSTAIVRICSRCKVERPRTAEFWNRHKESSDGLTYWCKACSRAAAAAYFKSHRAEQNAKTRLRTMNSPNLRRRVRLRRYGLTPESHMRMFLAQGGKCAICHEHPRGKRPTLMVDHDHDGGHVRGLLCHNCNAALGHVRDRADILASAMRYLERAAAAAIAVNE